MALFACGTNSPNKDISMSPAAQNYYPRESYDTACGERSPERLLKGGEGVIFIFFGCVDEGVHFARLRLALDHHEHGRSALSPPADLDG